MDHPHNYGPSNSKRSYTEIADVGFDEPVLSNPDLSSLSYSHSPTAAIGFSQPHPEAAATAGDDCPQPQLQVPLPLPVQQKLNSICEEKKQPQPGAELRRRLGLLGEEKALELLGEIYNTKKMIKTVSGYIWFLLRQKKYQCAPRSRSPSPSLTKSGPAASPLLHSPSSASQTTPGRQGSTSGGQRQLYSCFSASPSKSARTSLFQGPSSALPISPVPQGPAPVSNLGALPFGFKLGDSNYKIWSKMMEVHASGLNKMGYLNGQISALEETDPGFSKWQTEDAIVRGWLLKTMEPHLIELFIDLPTARDIWEGVTRMFYDGDDESQYYELRCKATRIKQNGRPINLYFAELKSVWQEMDKRRPNRMICAADLRSAKEDLEKDRVYDFLAGLDDSLDAVRSTLLRMKPVPGIEECFNTIRREAQRKTTMLGGKESDSGPSMAMISKPSSGPSRSLRELEDAEKDKLGCTHCNGTRHTKETSFEIHCYPEWFPERRKQRGRGKPNRRAAQAKVADSGPGLAALISSGPSTSLQRAGLAEPKAQIQVGQQSSGGASNNAGVSEANTLGPSADFVRIVESDPDNLAQQLSLLNLIASQEKTDNPEYPNSGDHWAWY